MKTMIAHLLPAVFCLTFTTGALADSPETRELTRQVDEVFAEWDATDSPGCALSVIRGGAVVYARGYGMANLEHHLAITPRSVFRIGSTSKQFTAAAVALLAEQGKLSLDDDVRKYVPELTASERPATVRHLIHHTSGLRDYLGLMWLSGRRDADYYTDEEVVEMLARQKALNFTPGDEHLYTNSGYFLLSVIVERASGQSLREFAGEHIFQPLGMRHTHFHDDHQMIVKNRADGYSRTEDGYEISKTTLEMVGDGGVFTSTEDLALWDRNFYDNKLGKGGPELIEQLLTPGTLNDGERLDYAFGLGVDQYRGLRKVSHGGAFVGYRADMIRFPDQKLSVICLCNVAQANPSALAQKVADLYLADELPEEETLAAGEDGGGGVELSEAELARVAGHYFNGTQGLLRKIEPRDGKLFYVRGPGRETPLAALGEDRFRMLEVPADVEVRFEPPEPGAAPNMIVTVNDGRPSVYQRVEPAKLTQDDLAAYTGKFYNDELDVTYEIAAGAETLTVTLGAQDIEMSPAFGDTFVGRVTLEFHRAASEVSGFTLSAGRIRGMKFLRR